jgi:trk system potassium uptake protein TrkA
MNILIVGAGNVGRHLARMLVDAEHTVTLIERDEVVVERARQESGGRVIRGDASEPSVLEKAGIRGMEVVVAVTGEDEDNIVVCNLAKFEFQVPRVVARVKNALNTWLYEPDIGVDHVVSAPVAIAQLIEEEVIIGSVVQLLRLPGGQSSILETRVPGGSPVVGKLIEVIPWPSECIPFAIVRGSQVLTTVADRRIEADDLLLFVATMAQTRAVHEIIAGESRDADVPTGNE